MPTSQQAVSARQASWARANAAVASGPCATMSPLVVSTSPTGPRARLGTGSIESSARGTKTRRSSTSRTTASATAAPGTDVARPPETARGASVTTLDPSAEPASHSSTSAPGASSARTRPATRHSMTGDGARNSPVSRATTARSPSAASAPPRCSGSPMANTPMSASPWCTATSKPTASAARTVSGVEALGRMNVVDQAIAPEARSEAMRSSS